MPPDPPSAHQTAPAPGPPDRDAGWDAGAVIALGSLLLLVELIVGYAVVHSFRFAVVAGAATTGLLLVTLAWVKLARPAKGWFAAGVVVLVAGVWAVAYQPLPGTAPALAVGVVTAGVLGCLGGLALAGRRPSAGQEPHAVVDAGLALAGVYLLVVGLAAPGGLVFLVAAPVLVALAIAVSGNRGQPRSRRLLFVALTLVGVLGVEALFFDRYRLAGLAALHVLLVALTASLAAPLGRARQVGVVVLVLAGAVALEGAWVLGLGSLVTQTAWWRLVLLTLLGLLGVLAASAASDLPLVKRAGVVVLVLLFGGGLYALTHDRAAVLGALGLGLSLVVVVYLWLHGDHVRPHRGLSRLVAATLALLVAAAVPTGALALLAGGIRTGPGYARQYGTLTTVQIGGATCTLEAAEPGAVSGSGRVTCPDATWTVDGQPTSGELLGTELELATDGDHADPVDAYVHGDRAYTRGLAVANRFTPLGRVVPLWLLVVLPLGLLAFIPLELRRPSRMPHLPRLSRALRTQLPVPDFPPPPAAERWSHHTVPLEEVVVDALRLAAREPGDGRPVTTGRFLATLARMDVRADWHRIWLHTGDPVAVGLADEPDPPFGGPPAHWHGIPISDRVARALALLERLCATYSLAPAGSGATMLALVADRRNGATAALLRQSRLRHGHLLQLVQTDILRIDLPGLSSIIPGATE